MGGPERGAADIPEDEGIGQPKRLEQAPGLAAGAVDRDPAILRQPPAARPQEQREHGEVDELAALEIDQDPVAPFRALQHLAQVIGHGEVELALDLDPPAPR